MIIPFFFRGTADRRRAFRDARRDLPPRLMRDIGLDPWPGRPRAPFPSLW